MCHSALLGIASVDSILERDTLPKSIHHPCPPFATDHTRPFLSPQFRVLRQKGTERPGSHEYDKKFDEGVYRTCTAANCD